MSESLEERLRGHAKAFDSLLSLIPAKLYYGEDTSDQWQRKKQSKEQKRQAKLAKLDPDAAKSAKDVMVERAQKRKREEEDDGSDREGAGTELPREGMKKGTKKSKKQKKEVKTKDGPVTSARQKDSQNGDATGTHRSKAEKAEAKRERVKAQKAESRNEKKQARKQRKERLRRQQETQTLSTDRKAEGGPQTDEGGDEEIDHENDSMDHVENDEEISFSGTLLPAGQDNDQIEAASTATPSSAPQSPAFDGPSLHSGSSSISSIPPPTTKPEPPKELTEKPEKPEKLKIPQIDSEELKERLRKRLEEMRAARKADGLDGKPARNRQELIEARRRKEEQRKAHKKELRQKAKEEEQRKIDEDLARRFSPAAGSLLASPRSPAPESSNNFSFGRISFADGQQTDPGLSSLVEQRKRKGPQDPLGAFKVAKSKEARLAGYDEAKRSDIEQKDMWLNAKKRAHGERVRDDTSLLKKALKRKESTKRKSEKEWDERIEGVQKGQQMKQNKREENLRKRKEEKGVKGKKGKGKKVKPRPGFEGSFKARAGTKK